MYFARVIQIEGSPALVIYAHTTGTHKHHDNIEGVTLDGQCITRRFPEEHVLTGGVQEWLIDKTEKVLGVKILGRPWGEGISIHLNDDAKASIMGQPATAAA